MPDEFVVYPAIDLRRGSVVRLRQGDPEAATLYSDDPAAAARRWRDEGASWLHIVNLDGAFQDETVADETPINLVRLREICAAVDLPIQYGGGIRGRHDIARALEMGATRVVIGTLAMRQPSAVAEVVREFGPAAVVVALDARDQIVAVDGWQTDTGVNALDAARSMRDLGVIRVLYTDVSRDGMLLGPNVEATATLARRSGLKVIASGGVASLDHVSALAACAAEGVDGAIIGQALYAGTLALPDALVAARVAGKLTGSSGRAGE